MQPLQLDGVSRSFGGLWAVRGVSLTIEPGKVTGLIGPNGAGKSTVVNLIAGLTALTSGTIKLGTDRIDQLEPANVARHGVARTFQNVRLLADETVVDNIAVGYRPSLDVPLIKELLDIGRARQARREARADALTLLKRFGMERFANYLAGDVSYGHQRRIEIMRALAFRPKVLLLDEPVAGMNDVEAESLAGEFRAIADSGVAVLLIEHNMQMVMKLCDHVHVLAAGELIASGRPADVRNDPRVVTAYLGDD